MAKKRSYEEIEEIDYIDEVNGPISSSRVHGAIISLSPVKRGAEVTFSMGCLLMSHQKSD